MIPTEKQEAKDKLRQTVLQLDQDTLRYWLMLFRGDETLRKHSGYSKGADDMLSKLVKAYESKHAKLMAPFDRGDYD
jgi:hypothetical protein